MKPPVIDPRRLPRCHRCNAPCVVTEISPGINSVMFYHERWCPAPDNPADRERLASLLATAYEATP